MLNQYKSNVHQRNEVELEKSNVRLKEVNQEIAKTLEVVCQSGISIDTVSEKLQSSEEEKDIY